MAGVSIHMSIAKNVNKVLCLDENELLIGSIVPDVSKYIGETKEKTHFLNDENNAICNISLFLSKYKLATPFDVGYFIHLLTDVLFFRDFLPKFVDFNFAKLERNEQYKNFLNSLYCDYSYLNKYLINKYELDINILKDKNINIKSNIEEFDFSNMNLYLNIMQEFLLKDSSKNYILNIVNIDEFVDYATQCIIKYIQENDLIKIKKEVI